MPSPEVEGFVLLLGDFKRFLVAGVQRRDDDAVAGAAFDGCR